MVVRAADVVVRAADVVVRAAGVVVRAAGVVARAVVNVNAGVVDWVPVTVVDPDVLWDGVVDPCVVYSIVEDTVGVEVTTGVCVVAVKKEMCSIVSI